MRLSLTVNMGLLGLAACLVALPSTAMAQEAAGLDLGWVLDLGGEAIAAAAAAF